MTRENGETGITNEPAPQVTFSDAELLDGLIKKIALKPSDPVTVDLIYKTYSEAKEASDTWNKYYMISVILLIMSASRAISELSMFGGQLKISFLAPTAIVYFCICTLVYMNHDLKMRFYHAFFKLKLDGFEGSEKVEFLMRYPLAFYGADYVVRELRGPLLAVSIRQIVGLIPVLAALLLGKAAAVFGLMGLTAYVLIQMTFEPALATSVKVAVWAFFIGTIVAAANFLRDPKKKFSYDPIP